ncbi:RelA/SpoT domain-containing protein [Leeuwenhoekiella palythoae]|uniref:RelA/SpoT domain-containing protein n=1 Tax=Leeuwenhoekiella palythoae TaxID=573501 RepID=UPI0035176FEB
MGYTNGEINRLGKRIVETSGKINKDDLQLLQVFRTSFSNPLTQTFNELITIKNNVRQSAIVALRLKRISTIVNKVLREPEMNLSRMGDIAGIRLIFEHDREVYKALELIQDQFEQSGKIRDYIQEPKRIGYRGVHIYVKDRKLGKRIEIQLRTTSHHNWSTLVEISDLLFETRLKELGYDSAPKFAEFHALMSSDKELTDDEADLVYDILEEKKFISVLSRLFRKNNNKVRKQWDALAKGSKYFLIEASKDQVPNLKSYKVYEDAERDYFNAYKQNENSEIVLTAISKPTFQQICIAYANYILSYHTFVRDVEPIIKNLAFRALEEKSIKKFKQIFKTYEELQANLLLDLIFDEMALLVAEQKDGKIIVETTRDLSKTKVASLTKRFNERIENRAKLHSEFIHEIELYIPTGFLREYRCKSFLSKHNKRLKGRLEKLQIEFRS